MNSSDPVLVSRHTIGTLLQRVLVYGTLIGFLGIVVYPIMWLAISSLRSDKEIFYSPFGLPRFGEFQWINFSNAWNKGHFGSYFWNSASLTVGTVVLTVLLGAMAAYALTRFRFFGARPLFYFFLAGLMIPLQLAITPLFFQLKTMHLLNSRLGLLIVYVAFGLPFAIFVLTGFFKSLPEELHEAALIDGCGEVRAFFNVMLPLARPGLITVVIFTFINAWNEYLMAFMFLSGQGSEQLRTLPLGLANLTIESQYRTDWGMAFAALVLMTLPVFVAYVFLQRHLTKGIMMGAIKG